MIKVHEGDVLRYLGNRKTSADARVLTHIENLNSEISSIIVPKSIYRLLDCLVDPQTVTFGGVTIHSEHLTRHLDGCSVVAVFAVTLGARADTLIHRYGVSEINKAVIADAVCTAMTETLCDNVRREIESEPEVSGLNPTTRFSPGFGDFDIAHQQDILTLLDCPKRIGLTLTSGNMLCPSKSVTAVIGFGSKT